MISSFPYSSGWYLVRIIRQHLAIIWQWIRQSLFSPKPGGHALASSTVQGPMVLGDQILLALQKIAAVSAQARPATLLEQDLVTALHHATNFPVILLERDDVSPHCLTVTGCVGMAVTSDPAPLCIPLAQLSTTGLAAQVRATQTFAACTGPDVSTAILHPGLSLSQTMQLKAAISVPLITHRHLLGTLTVAHTQEIGSIDAWGHWLTSLATQMAALLGDHRLRTELAQTQERLAQTATAANALLYEWDVQTEQVLRTPTLEPLSGYSLIEAEPTLDWWRQRVHPEDQGQLNTVLQTHSPRHPQFEMEYRWRHRDGHYLNVCDRGVIIFDGQQPLRVVGTIDDVSPHVQATLHYQEQQQHYQRLLDSVKGVVFQTDTAGHLTFLHQSWRELTGFTVTESLGQPLWNFVHRDDQAAHEASFTTLIQRAQDEGDYEHRYHHEARYMTRQGANRWVEIHGQLIVESDHTLRGLSGTLTDQTDRKQVESQLLHEAHHDELTGLPNRLMFMDCLDQLTHSPTKASSPGFAILFLDLDGFKKINDTWGHHVGDQLLVAVAQRLQACVRPEDTVARLGGDEFTVLLSPIQTVQAAQLVCDRILSSFSEAFELETTTILSSASIGVALSHKSEDHPEALLRQADVALYQAKASGKGCSVIFNTDAPEQQSSVPAPKLMGTPSTPPLLVISTPTGQTHVPLVGQTRWVLGRSKNSDIVFGDRAVSRTHAEVQLHDSGTYYLVDLNSGNGTFLNGNRMAAPHPLRDGDRITLGLTHLKFQGGDLAHQAGHVDPKPKTVFLLQASNLQRHVWRELLTSQGIPLTVLETNLDLTQLIRQRLRAHEVLPDVLLLDMTAIQPNPYHFCRWCRQAYPQIKIILTSGTRTLISAAERKWAIHQGATELLPGFPEPHIFAHLSQVIHKVKLVLDALDWHPVEQQSLNSALATLRQQPTPPSDQL